MMKNTKENADVGIIVARFQSPFLHEGHLDILKQVSDNHPRVVVFLGISPLKCSLNNPYDFVIRMGMVKEKFPEIEVYPIDDVGDDELWSINLDDAIRKYISSHLKVVLYGSRDSFLKSYKGNYPTLELIPNKFVSARDIRREVSIKAKNTQDFRIGIAYTVENQHPSVKTTVDVAVINTTNDNILLVRKRTEKLFRFPGGHSDVKDQSFEDDAMRETKEETRLVIANPMYIGSTLVNDWRYRSEKDKIKTLFFAANYLGGEAIPSDDLKGGQAVWRNVFDIAECEIMPEHRVLLQMLKAWGKNNGLTKT